MAEAVEYTPGGIANVALGLTRLGVDAAIWAPVGDDISGRVLNGLLADEGIDWVGPPAGCHRGVGGDAAERRPRLPHRVPGVRDRHATRSLRSSRGPW